MTGFLIRLGALLFFLGCAGSPRGHRSETRETTEHGKPKDAPPGKQVETIEMRHQILFSGANREDVFEGTMILSEDAFVVRAFAGPGVSLFTVARHGNRRRDVLHIDGLSDRIDVVRIGDDINRIYLVGCDGASPPGERTCEVDGERIVEHFDEHGDLAVKAFPDAHGIGLHIVYEGYSDQVGRRLPRRITLEWGGTNNRMVILTTEVARGADDALERVEAVLSGE